jgi:hypothetical protein
MTVVKEKFDSDHRKSSFGTKKLAAAPRFLPPLICEICGFKFGI